MPTAAPATRSSDIPPAYRAATDRRHCTGSRIADDPCHELYEQFLSQDQVRFSTGLLAPVETMRAAHARLISLEPRLKSHPKGATTTTATLTLRALAAESPYAKIHALLTAAGIPHTAHGNGYGNTMSHNKAEGMPGLEHSDLYMRQANALVRTDLVPDSKIWTRAPFDLWCSDAHCKIRRRAPELGAHNDSILMRGQAFRERPPGHPAILPRVSATDAAGRTHSADATYSGDNVVVIELSGMGQSIAGAATMLCDEGANVYKCLIGGRDPIDEIEPFFSEQLNRGKVLVAVEGLAQVRKMVETAYSAAAAAGRGGVVVFATNFPEAALVGAKLDGKALREDMSGVVHVHMTPRGPGGAAEGGGNSCTTSATASARQADGGVGPAGITDDISSFFSGGLLCDVLGAGTVLDPAMPLLWGTQIASIHVKTAIDLALLHHARTGGEGQRVELNLLRCGLYCNLMYFSLTLFQANKGSEMGLKVDKMSFETYRTADGKWLQMLGVDYKKHVPRMFKALGIAGASYRRVIWAALTGFDRKNPLALVPVVFGKVTECIREAIAAKTWAELEPIFKAHDVWHTSVATPAEAACNEQARATRAFRYASAGQINVPAHVRVNAPLQMTRWAAGDMTARYGDPDEAPDVGPTQRKRSIAFAAFAGEVHTV
jgi:crotonobetainyl-CoA:carnitine CoA-transferase CaiB-like acyl-CoA transferase